MARFWAASAQNNAFGEGTITGAVTDTSGSVLQGVTVEVTSPALFEKVRHADTDGRVHVLGGRSTSRDARVAAFKKRLGLPP
jgi:hypothetical protein